MFRRAAACLLTLIAAGAAVPARTPRVRPPAPIPGENVYVRNVMSDIYLWYAMMPNVNPTAYDSPEAYLEAVRYKTLDSTFQLHHVTRRQRRVLLGQPVHRLRSFDQLERSRDARAAGVSRQPSARSRPVPRRSDRRDRRPDRGVAGGQRRNRLRVRTVGDRRRDEHRVQPRRARAARRTWSNVW